VVTSCVSWFSVESSGKIGNGLALGEHVAPDSRTDSATRFPAEIAARFNVPFHLPALGQEIASRGYLSPKNDPIRREPIPINPRNLVAGLRQFRLGSVFPLLITLIFLGRGFPLVDGIVTGI